jgi:DNA polymerase-1
MRTLLIDGDLYAFSTAVAFQEENPFTGELDYNEKLAQNTMDKRIAHMCEKVGSSKTICFFSCDRTKNWRRDIVPSYKENRDDKLKPVGLKSLIEYMKKRLLVIEEDTLEADDLIGIYATDRRLCKDPVICSYDKDFMTIPGIIFNSRKDTIKSMDKETSFKAFIYQTILGDSSDGYKGIYKIGPKKAKAFIIKHEKNLKDIWDPLVELAEKQGHDEEYLINQARMAHILQFGDYDFNKKRVRLWTPELIEEML